jgi:hypothetical protein
MHINTEKLDKYTAARIAEAINCWAGKEHRKEIITSAEVMKLQPITTDERNGYVIFPYQWGDVTILVWLRNDGSLFTKTVSW